MKKVLLIAAASLAACLWSCQETARPEGKPFDELPAVGEEVVFAFLNALPADAVPEGLKTAEERAAFKAQYDAYFQAWNEFCEDPEAHEDSPFYEWSEYEDYDGPGRLERELYWGPWSYNLDMMGEYDYEPEYPTYSFTLMIYPGVEAGKYYGVTYIGTSTENDYVESPYKYYWFDMNKKKVTPSQLLLNRPYTVEDATSDGLLTYGVEGLYYTLQNPDEAFTLFFSEKKMEVYLTNMGQCIPPYYWDGVQFVSDPNGQIECFYGYSFGQIRLGDKSIPFDIHGYDTQFEGQTEDGYGYRYQVVREGEVSPTLTITSYDGEINTIEVWSDRYCDFDGNHAGMPVNELLDNLRTRIQNWMVDWDEPNVNDYAPDYIYINSGLEDNFYYKVYKDENYLGNGKFRKGATVTSIIMTSGVG